MVAGCPPSKGKYDSGEKGTQVEQPAREQNVGIVCYSILRLLPGFPAINAGISVGWVFYDTMLASRT